MEQVSNLLGHMTKSTEKSYRTWEEIQQDKCDIENRSTGTLQGYVCPKCINRGYIARLNADNDIVLQECECMAIRRNKDKIRRSGLADTLEANTFDKFIDKTEWQKRAKFLAKKYADNPEGWLIAFGQSGSGKTHLCTAVCNDLLNKGYEVRYFMWREIVQKCNALKFKDIEFDRYIDEIANAEVLYIDDFLKSKNPELDIAFQIINTRYIRNKLTIISSELLIEDIKALDTAIAGRINQKATVKILIKEEADRNYRFKED